jgi:hypothetical protein
MQRKSKRAQKRQQEADGVGSDHASGLQLADPKERYESSPEATGLPAPVSAVNPANASEVDICFSGVAATNTAGKVLHAFTDSPACW